MSAAQDRYRRLLENIPDAFARHRILWDRDGHWEDCLFLEVNTAFAKMMGWAGDQIIGKKTTEVYPGPDQGASPEWMEAFTKALGSGQPVRFAQYFPSLERWVVVPKFNHGSVMAICRSLAPFSE